MFYLLFLVLYKLLIKLRIEIVKILFIQLGLYLFPPPYLETLVGNIHILPIPTAEPMQDRINPQFVFQESL